MIQIRINRSWLYLNAHQWFRKHPPDTKFQIPERCWVEISRTNFSSRKKFEFKSFSRWLWIRAKNMKMDNIKVQDDTSTFEMCCLSHHAGSRELSKCWVGGGYRKLREWRLLIQQLHRRTPHSVVVNDGWWTNSCIFKTRRCKNQSGWKVLLGRNAARHFNGDETCWIWGEWLQQRKHACVVLEMTDAF